MKFGRSAVASKLVSTRGDAESDRSRDLRPCRADHDPDLRLEFVEGFRRDAPQLAQKSPPAGHPLARHTIFDGRGTSSKSAKDSENWPSIKSMRSRRLARLGIQKHNRVSHFLDSSRTKHATNRALISWRRCADQSLLLALNCRYGMPRWPSPSGAKADPE